MKWTVLLSSLARVTAKLSMYKININMADMRKSCKETFLLFISNLHLCKSFYVFFVRDFRKGGLINWGATTVFKFLFTESLGGLPWFIWHGKEPQVTVYSSTSKLVLFMGIFYRYTRWFATKTQCEWRAFFMISSWLSTKFYEKKELLSS